MARSGRVLVSALLIVSAVRIARADEQIHVVTASSFADPADVAAYKKCIKAGRTDCFALGDNGIGLWGDDTTVAKPMCALPREDWLTKWKKPSVARGKRIEVSFRGKKITCELRDTMPAKAKRLNKAGIDLNPGAAKALGLRPPFMQQGVSWRWFE